MGIPGIMRNAYIAILLMNLVLRGGSVTDICQTATADIVFIVDSSGSVGSSGYADEIDFIKAIVNELVIDPNEVRMGLIDYSTSVHTSLGFNLNDPNFDTNAEVIAKLNSLPYSGGSTRTDLAIQAAKNMFSGPGNRPDVPDVLFTLTDGETNDGGQDLLDDRVDELKAMFPDLTSIAVGVKDFDIYELNYIASDRSLIFTVDNFDDLDTILDLVLQEICTPPPPEVCVGENCTTTDQCKDDNAVCDQAEGICLCAHGFILDQKGNCVDCHSIDFTTFLTSFPCDGISFCGANQVLIGDTCYGTKVTETCTTTLNTCTDCHAFCNGTVCDCVDGYHWNGTHCVGSSLCDECSYHPDSCGGDLVCGAESGRCECPPALPIQYDGECYGTQVTETCTTTLNTCTDRHAFCNGTVCDCVDGYYWNGTHCVGSALCDDCGYQPDSCGGDLVCGAESGRCECPPAIPIQYDGECYGTRVTERCPGGLNTCTDCNAYCNGTVCICFDGFYWNGSRCVGSQIDEPCEASPDSCATNGLVCGPTYRCECPYFDVQFENECYALTCGECQADSDCLDPNQICVVDGEATICVCKNDYYLDYCGICSPRLSNGSDCSCDDQCLSGYCICGICEHTDEGDCCNDCTDFRSDIVFVTDASGSVKTANYQKIKAFVIALGNAFQISDIDTRIGLVDYSYAINYVYPLDAFNDNFDFTLSICSQPYSSGTTRTDLGLAEARSILLDSANRPFIPNFVIVITDGMTTEPYATNNLPTEIALLKAVPDTTIFAIGIGTFDTSELEAIASGPEYVYTTASFDTLKNLIGQLLIAICTSGPPPDK